MVLSEKRCFAFALGHQKHLRKFKSQSLAQRREGMRWGGGGEEVEEKGREEAGRKL